MTGLHISLFGPLEIRQDGEVLARIGSAKVSALLAYLAAEARRPQSRGTLSGLLWPGYPQASANQSLRQALYSLHKALGDPDWLEADRRAITLVPEEGCQVDALELEQALSTARAALTTDGRPQTAGDAVRRLRSAVNAYRGPFLEGFSLPDSPEFEAWVLNRRQHHERQALEALGLLVDHFQRAGDYGQAEEYSRRQLEIEPWRESAHQQVMRLLALQNKRSQALAEFNRCRIVLAQELHAQPSPETVKLFEQIQAGMFPTPPDIQLDTPVQSPTGGTLPTWMERKDLKKSLGTLKSEIHSIQQRKQATLLFMDIVGHTRLIHDLDPEDNMEIIDSALVRLTEPIVLNGGHVARYQGDGFKAVFGLPLAKENDPQAAVKAALDIQKIAVEIADMLEREQNLDGFKVRVGIDTGLVVSGGITEGQETIKGLPVNLGARLESAAPAGGILISHNTYRHVRGLFEVQELEPIHAKGFDKPIRVYSVLNEKPRAFRMATREFEGFETATIGREAELLTLQNAYHDVIEGMEPRMITIVGDAGVGKSRLLYEFENWVELLPGDRWVFKSRAALESIHKPGDLWHFLFSNQFQIQESDSLAKTKEKFLAGITGYLEEEKAPLLGQVVGFDFSDYKAVLGALQDPQFNQIAAAYLAKYLRNLNEINPVLLLLEDVHWADDHSLDLLDLLLTSLVDCRILVICLARPVLYERRPDWGSGQAYGSRLDLKSLSVRHSKLLGLELLRHVQEPPEEIINILVTNAEGNPFYMEELVKMLLDQGVIVRGELPEDPWRFELDQLVSAHLPETLAGVLQARMDGLPEDEKDILQRASVVGRLFWDQAVDYLGESGLQPKPIESMRQVWPRLRGREMVFHRERTTFANTQEYIFKHALLRETVYESVLRRIRREYHKLAAQWVIIASGNRADEFASLIADHWFLAGEMDQEAHWQLRAAKWAVARYAHAEALRRLERAFDLIPETELTKRYEVLQTRERIYDLQGRRDLQAEVLDQLEALAEKLDDFRYQADAALRISRQKENNHDYPVANSYAQKALMHAKKIGDLALQAEAYLCWGDASELFTQDVRSKFDNALALARESKCLPVEMEVLQRFAWITHQFEEKIGYLERALKIARQLGNRRKEGALLQNIGGAIWDYEKHASDRSVSDPQNYVKAKEHFTAALEIYREIGARFDEARALHSLGYAAAMLEEKPGLKEYQIQALQVLQQIGDLHQAVLMIHRMGESAMFDGNHGEARRYFTQAQYLAREIDDKIWEAYASFQIGTTYLVEHNYLACLALADENLTRFRQHEMHWGESGLLMEMAWALVSLGNYRQAKIHCSESLQIARQYEINTFEGLALTISSWIARGMQDYPLALETINQALDLFRQSNQHNWEMFCYNKLGFALLGSGKPDEAIRAFQKGMETSREFKFFPRVVENQAGWAKALLDLHDLPAAMALVDEVLDYLQTGYLDRTDQPILVYLNCCEVLRAAQDERADQVLKRAYDELMARASTMDDSIKQSFLDNVSENAAVRALYETWFAEQ